MLTGLRGLAQAFVRGAVAIGRRIKTTYTALATLGLRYAMPEFEFDWFMYDQQKAFISLATDLPRDQLIPGEFHGESNMALTCKFRYDVSAIYENIKGKTVKGYWSVISDVRLTQEEIEAKGQDFAEDYAPEGFPFHGPVQLEGIWTRKE